eukprot:PITA_19626
MNSFFLFISLFSIHVALTSAIDVREMSIDEYINFVNPPPVHKFQGLKKSPKPNSSTLDISNFDSGAVNNSKLGFKSECPEDTVEVREIKREDVERAGSVRQFLERDGRRKNAIPNVNYRDGTSREHAVVHFKCEPSNPAFGVSSLINIWRPQLPEDGYFSNSQIWLSTESSGTVETIEVGWTSDDYRNGCYDLECPGYVPIAGARSPGTDIERASTLGGRQTEFQIHIKQRVVAEADRPVWALLFENEVIGYWPLSLFDGLNSGGSFFDAGGEVCYRRRDQGSAMTRTPMGSGGFPWTGYHHAAYHRLLKTYNTVGEEINCRPYKVETRPACYSMEYEHTDSPFWGKRVFFGGPGGVQNNPDCVV